MSNFQRFLVGSLLLFCLLNIGGLWGVTFLKEQRSLATQPTAVSPSSQSELETLAKEVAELKAQIQRLNQPATTLSASPLPSIPTGNTTLAPKLPVSTSSPQEQVIFMGSGQTTERDWTTMTGATVTINRDLYPRIKQVTFEASLSIIGGEAQARLLNLQNGAIMDVTTLINNTPVAVWKRSPSFTLFAGSNTYAVQVRSTSGDLARLEGARVIIVTQ